MAEPDWSLIQSTLQQLQADNAEFRGLFRQILIGLGGLQNAQTEAREEVTYALGLIVATQRDMNRAEARIEEIVARLEKVEAH